MSATPNQVQISGQIQLADLDALKGAGIGTVINNRPDGEAPDQPSSQEVEAKATELGMKYFYVPVSPRGLTEDNLEKMAEALEAHILSMGGSVDAGELYTRFRGRLPGVDALLKGRGLAA